MAESIVTLNCILLLNEGLHGGTWWWPVAMVLCPITHVIPLFPAAYELYGELSLSDPSPWDPPRSLQTHGPMLVSVATQGLA